MSVLGYICVKVNVFVVRLRVTALLLTVTMLSLVHWSLLSVLSSGDEIFDAVVEAFDPSVGIDARSCGFHNDQESCV